MKKTLLFISVLASAMMACKKDDSTKDQNTKLIVGSWKSTGQNTKVYDLTTNDLLKDSTIAFTGKSAALAWVEVYQTNGSGFVTTVPVIKAKIATADTTSYLSYSILGSNLTIKQSIGGSATKSILELTDVDMDLQSTATGNVAAGWGLDVNASYKITTSTHYAKQ